MVAIFAQYGSATANTVPAGWTVVSEDSFTAGDTVAATLAYKVAGASEPASYTFTVPGTSSYPVACIASYSGSSGIGSSNINSAAAATRSNAGLTTTADNSIVLLLSLGYNNTLLTAPSGMTQRQSWDGGVDFAWDETKASTGATGTRNSIHSDGGNPNNLYISQLIEIKGT
jgi:hypothetical protein